ncbi:MAG: hypothetical protein M3277_06825 [Actinomycetota bacterium]|nr:hypothetical protein [Actinomycetota bacterium]
MLLHYEGVSIGRGHSEKMDVVEVVCFPRIPWVSEAALVQVEKEPKEGLVLEALDQCPSIDGFASLRGDPRLGERGCEFIFEVGDKDARGHGAQFPASATVLFEKIGQGLYAIGPTLLSGDRVRILPGRPRLLQQE